MELMLNSCHPDPLRAQDGGRVGRTRGIGESADQFQTNISRWESWYLSIMDSKYPQRHIIWVGEGGWGLGAAEWEKT